VRFLLRRRHARQSHQDKQAGSKNERAHGEIVWQRSGRVERKVGYRGKKKDREFSFPVSD
jgi:hypothetical protein